MTHEIHDDARSTYSSHGEDVIARVLLERFGKWRDQGFFVDVGAFHPTVASNTADFSDLGWTGVHVEPNPGMADRLRAARPNDVVVQCAIGAERRIGHLYFFYEWASSNTLDADFADAIAAGQELDRPTVIEVQVLPLRELLAADVAAGQTIDFMSVDVEGLDLEVLRSNDWTAFRPILVMVEDIDLRLDDLAGSPVFMFMNQLGYRMVAHAVLTSFYMEV